MTYCQTLQEAAILFNKGLFFKQHYIIQHLKNGIAFLPNLNMSLPIFSQSTFSNTLFKFSVLIAWLFGSILTKCPPLNIKLIIANQESHKHIGNYLKNTNSYFAFITLACNIILFINYCFVIKLKMYANFRLSDLVNMTSNFLGLFGTYLVRRGLLAWNGCKLQNLLIEYYAQQQPTFGNSLPKRQQSGPGFINLAFMLFYVGNTLILMVMFSIQVYTGNLVLGLYVPKVVFLINTFTMTSAATFVKLAVIILGNDLLQQYESITSQYIIKYKRTKMQFGLDQADLITKTAATSRTVIEKKIAELEGNNTEEDFVNNWNYPEYLKELQALEKKFKLYNDVFGMQIVLVLLEAIIVFFVGHLFLLLVVLLDKDDIEYKSNIYQKYFFASTLMSSILNLWVAGHIGQVMENRVKI